MSNEYSDVYTALLATRNRPYHNTDHLWQVRETLEQFIEVDDELITAIDFHDIVYEPGSSENEVRSANKAADMYPEHAEFVWKAIMATKYHKATGNHKIDLFLDADMSILGMPWPQYDAYRKAIRKEYAAFSDEEFKKGRKAFLKSFNGFITDEFNNKYRDQAMSNIRRELNEFDGIFVVIKPRGTVSVLQDVTSGIQPQYEPDYIRNFTWEP